MNLKELCEIIRLQKEMVTQIEDFVAAYDMESLDPLIEELRHPQTTFAGIEKLQERFEYSAPAYIPLLTCLLLAAARNYPVFKKKGIPEEIYVDTMAAFTRFCKETHEKTGCWYFDHAGWSCRQASMRLFRIGILEYEFMEREGEPMISIHIPSDTVFSEGNLDHTIKGAKEFVERFYPEHMGERFFCDSWMMAPRLRELLPETAGIIRFQNRFAMVEEPPFPDACLGWVFRKTAETPLCELPENTSLQRKIKELMLNGGHLYAGFGILDTER